MRDSVPAMLMTFESASKRRSLRAEPDEKVNDRLGSLSHVGGVIGGRAVDAVGAGCRCVLSRVFAVFSPVFAAFLGLGAFLSLPS
jgi:hypothetical protein